MDCGELGDVLLVTGFARGIKRLLPRKRVVSRFTCSVP